MITIEMDVRTAAAVRQVLYAEQKIYTQDPTCTPPRITDIRGVIYDIDNGIAQELKEDLESEATNS